jgi:hypothetical protein
MNCERYKVIIEKYIDGAISDTELASLKEHARGCSACSRELRDWVKTQGIIQDSFSPTASAAGATESILSRLSSQPEPAARMIVPKPITLFGKQFAAAASILVVAGFLLGFGSARIDNIKARIVRMTSKVPIRVSGLEGTVLVKHQASKRWSQLKNGSGIYLGDTFRSTAKSRAILTLAGQSTIQLNQNSTLLLRVCNGGTEFYLEHGELAAALNSPHPPFIISTPHGRVEALGTKFTIAVE